MATASAIQPKKLSFKKIFEKNQSLHEKGRHGEAYRVWEKFVITLIERIPYTILPYVNNFQLSEASDGKLTYSKWFFAKMYFLALNNSSGHKKYFWECVVNQHGFYGFDFSAFNLVQRELSKAWDGCVQIHPLFDPRGGGVCGFKISLTEFEVLPQDIAQKQEEP